MSALCILRFGFLALFAPRVGDMDCHDACVLIGTLCDIGHGHKQGTSHNFSVSTQASSSPLLPSLGATQKSRSIWQKTYGSHKHTNCWPEKQVPRCLSKQLLATLPQTQVKLTILDSARCSKASFLVVGYDLILILLDACPGKSGTSQYLLHIL